MSTDTKLLAAQARIRVLREALESAYECIKFYSHPGARDASIALATPDDTAELDALIADAEKRGYQAAIAAIREGGPAAWIHPNAETFPKHVANSIPVYTLPEDLL